MKELVLISIIALAIGHLTCGQLIKNLVKDKNLKPTAETLHVEVLCLIDDATYDLHGSDLALYKYMLSYWKTVDKYFQLLSEPRVRITLSQILCLQGHYIPSLSEFNNTRKVLTALGDFIYAQKNDLPHHDVAVLITPFELVTYDYKNNTIHQNEIGNTFRAKACHIDHENKTVKSVAVVRDDGKLYKGIKKTISLIGKLLGAGENILNYYIMHFNNDLNSTMRFDWALFSRNEVKDFFNRGYLNCLFNEPTTNISLEAHWLPGQEVSLDKQCEILTGNFGNCWEYNDSFCREMYCRDKFGQCALITESALEGSWCGDINGVQHRCSYGRCEPFYPPRNETPSAYFYNYFYNN